MRRIQCFGEEVALHESLNGIEGDAGEERYVFEGGEEVGRCGLDFGSLGFGGGEG